MQGRPKKQEESEAEEEVGSEHETDEDEEEDYLEELPDEINNKYKKGPRASVSAEAFGQFNKKEAYKPNVIQKPEESRQKIAARLASAFMFSALDEKERGIVIDAMGERRTKEGEVVIKEGDEGDNLYVVEHGTLTCTKVFKGNTEPTKLKVFQPGEAFGELALLYNAPRAATITSDGHCLLWALDRNTFNHIVKDAASKKR